MKNYSAVTEPKDIATKEYVDTQEAGNVQYTQQVKTDSQKQTARENIGASAVLIRNWT